MQGFDQSVSIELSADIAWIPLVQSVVENGAPVCGLENSKTMMLTIAAEEIVAHLAKTAPGTRINFSLGSGGWHVKAEFSFKADPSHLWAMNLVTKTDADSEDGMDHLGLLLASRAVDSFTLRIEGDTVHLTLQKDRDYPVVEPKATKRVKTRGELTIARSPEPELIKAACIAALGLYPSDTLPQPFFTPGKVADMVAAKDLDIAVALDKTGALAGLICWQTPSELGVSFSGPYLFDKEGQAGEILTKHLINTVARTRAMGLFSELATTGLSTLDFESLGHLDIITADGEKSVQNVWYRHLREDMGASVWAHSTYLEFLEKRYKEQILMRDIKMADGQGETLPERSVFSARLRPETGEATLVPMVTGKDAALCIARHVKMLHKEKFSNIYIRLDLAYGWQASMGKSIMDNDFVPRLVLPYGGKSDILVFQYAKI